MKIEMKVGYIQTSPIFGEKEKNFQHVAELSKNIKANLVVLPELFATGYAFVSKKEAESMAEEKEGNTGRFLQKIAKETDAVVVGGFIEREGKKIYNSSLMVSDKGIIDTYRKIHLYFKEKLWFTPGNKPLRVYEVNGVKVGMMICFDWIFPEVTRTLALLGADIIAHPANLVLPYCQKAMVTRCLSNHIFAVTCNRMGSEQRGENNFKFTGASQITSFDGKILSFAPTDKEFVEIVEINPENARNKNLNELNNLISDRREKFYFSKHHKIDDS